MMMHHKSLGEKYAASALQSVEIGHPSGFFLPVDDRQPVNFEARDCVETVEINPSLQPSLAIGA